jgi:hypothetical protein
VDISSPPDRRLEPLLVYVCAEDECSRRHQWCLFNSRGHVYGLPDSQVRSRGGNLQTPSHRGSPRSGKGPWTLISFSPDSHCWRLRAWGQPCWKPTSLPNGLIRVQMLSTACSFTVTCLLTWLSLSDPAWLAPLSYNSNGHSHPPGLVRAAVSLLCVQAVSDWVRYTSGLAMCSRGSTEGYRLALVVGLVTLPLQFFYWLGPLFGAEYKVANFILLRLIYGADSLFCNRSRCCKWCHRGL